MTTLKLAAALALGVLAGNASAATYDATADFQNVANPSGVWSYGYSLLGGGSYSMILLDNPFTDVSANQWWASTTVSDSGVPVIYKNNTAAYLNGIAPGQLALHPGLTAFTVLRFTAPAADAYSVTGQFFAGDIGSESGALVLNGAHASPLAFFADTTDLSTFSLPTLSLGAGDTLDFVVGVAGSYLFGSTPIQVTIGPAEVSAPEPASMALLLGGLAALGAARSRRAAR